MKCSFGERKTRSGKQFSPFDVEPLPFPEYNLETSLAEALSSENYEDDVGLTAMPLDPDAEKFWHASSPDLSEKFIFGRKNSVATEFIFGLQKPALLHAVDSQTEGTANLANTAPPRTLETISPQTFDKSPPRLQNEELSLKRPRNELEDTNVRLSQTSSLKRARNEQEDTWVQRPEVLRTGKNARVHGKRAKRQAEKAKAESRGYHAPRPKVIHSFVQPAEPVKLDFDTETLPATSSGFTAKPGKRLGEGEYIGTLDELLEKGYTLVKWDGKSPRPLVSKTGQVFAVLVGKVAHDPTWMSTCEQAFEAIKKEGNEADFADDETHHCRGDFPAVNVGVTMGFGATYPTNLSTASHAEMLARLLDNKDIKRIANFIDGAFNLWAPDLYDHYVQLLNPLFDKLTYLRRIFDKCIFPTAAFNFGGNVVTKAHRDCMNSAVGWCGIIALGTFDPTKGGHIAFPDLKIVVEFPPGSVVLIPSATLTHANLPIVDGERASFTLYSSGGLFRYVVNGYRTESQLQKDDPQEYARVCELKRTRWMEDLKLYSTFEKLRLGEVLKD